MVAAAVRPGNCGNGPAIAHRSVAALETRHPNPLARSRELTEGHRRRIFLVLLPLGALGLTRESLVLKWVLGTGIRAG